ncbi:hypothetical protein T492DRAFT_1033331 [Pavlovales sp. CCMP2436]|nr:hypothetical protein T492DRAFT_1033331 [Pavlovales sp. CCMP2436]
MWCASALASLLLLFGSMLDGSRTEGAAPVLHPGRRVLSAQPEPIHRPAKHPSQCWEVVARVERQLTGKASGWTSEARLLMAATKDAVLESRDCRRSPSWTSRCSWQRGECACRTWSSSRRGNVCAAPSTALGEVEKVLQYRTYYRQEQWLIKWKDYGEDRNTWEPLAHLSDDVQVDAQRVKELCIERQLA